MENLIVKGLKQVSPIVGYQVKHPVRHQMPISNSTAAAIFGIFCLMGFAPMASQASTAFYTNAITFDAAEPGLTAINFSGLTAGLRPDNFSLAGVTFSTLNPGASASALLVFDNMIGNNWFGDTLNLTFPAAVNAVGAEIVSQVGETGGSPISAPITETVYSGSAIIGQKIITEASGFFGVTSSSPISEITFFSDCQSDCSTFVSDLSFAQQTPVPITGSYALMLTGLGFMVPIVRRRSLQTA